ncbi:MAG: hypothetical protein IJF79_04875 [Clostridia bacterium]|nr:hypothetical protein [Clostridia bacterium]
MRYNKILILLLSLLLLTGCTDEPQPHIQMPDEVYDHPPVEVDFFSKTDISSSTEKTDLAPILLKRIEGRAIIEDIYLMLLKDSAIVQQLEDYNTQTAQLHMEYLHAALNYVIALYDLRAPDNTLCSINPSTIIHFTDDQHALAAKLAESCLYRDPRDREPDMLQHGDWIQDTQVNHSYSVDFNAYITSADSLTAALTEHPLTIHCIPGGSEIISQIASREKITADYSHFEPDVKAAIQSYNAYFATNDKCLKDFITLLAVLTRPEEAYSVQNNGHVLQPTQKELAFANLCVKYNLYNEPWQMLYRDPSTAQYIAGELGGSGGAWPHHMELPESYFGQIQMITDYLCE